MLYYFTEIVGFVFSVQNKSDFFLTEIPVTSIKKKVNKLGHRAGCLMSEYLWS